MSAEQPWFGIASYGGQIGNDRPPNHLADLDSHMAATPERVEAARLYWPERRAEEFLKHGSTGRRIIDRETGIVYSVTEHDPLQVENPPEDPTEFFLLTQSSPGWIYFMKRLGSGTPPAGASLSAATISGEIRQSWSGKPELIGEDGKVVPTRLTGPAATTFKERG
jgi:hypothetical protein